VVDVFQWSDSTQALFARSAFSDAILKRPRPPYHDPECLVGPPRYNGVVVHFSARCPMVRPVQTLRVVGSVPELGNWEPLIGLDLND
jgi:4-alpha-glucanotransferase